MDDAPVAIESGGRLRVFARKDIQETSLSPAKELLDLAPKKSVERGVPPTSWFPKRTPSEKKNELISRLLDGADTAVRVACVDAIVQEERKAFIPKLIDLLEAEEKGSSATSPSPSPTARLR